MRYSETEITTLVGQFSPGQTVTIKLIELSNDALVTVTSDVCVESLHIPGMYLWKTNNINDTSLIGYSNLLYEMTCLEDGSKFYGKFVFGGYVDDVVDAADLTGPITDVEEIRQTVHVINARI